MFKLLDKILSYFSGRKIFDDGSYVEYLDKEHLIYVDDDKKLTIGFDYNGGFSNTRTIVFRDIKNWNAPNTKNILNDAKKEDVLNKIISYCKENRIKYEVEK